MKKIVLTLTIFCVITCTVFFLLHDRHFVDINEIDNSSPERKLAGNEELQLNLNALEPNYKMLFQTESEFVNDDYRYRCVIFENEDERILYVIKEYKNGTYNLLVRNNNAILKNEEGGIWGDPFDIVSISKTEMKIVFYGGSSWRWQYSFLFKINGDKITLYKCRYAFKHRDDYEISNDKIAKNFDSGIIKYYFPKRGILKLKEMDNGKIKTKEYLLKQIDISLTEFSIYDLMEKMAYSDSE